GIYCAGEPCGIAGVDAALVQGQLAGLAAAGVPAEAPELQPLLRVRARWRSFAGRLEQVCALRPELRALPRPDTLVCRCEDVTLERIAAAGAQAAGSSWRSAKLLSRCGMGACQGRVCGPALEFLLGYAAVGPRPPVFPGRLAALQ
ncbi:MAG: (2Fe-2S)-binding protein, partial [Terriglobales bacterium]